MIYEIFTAYVDCAINGLGMHLSICKVYFFTEQLQNLIEVIQTFIMLVEDPENSVERPTPYTLCQHMLPQPQCRMLTQYNFPCPTSEEIKYQMYRVSLDSVNFCLVEAGTALNVQVTCQSLRKGRNNK